ncbi:NADH dehydrogenase, FAD-containing subunit [Pseudonocardia thermophila]|uniref:NADH dehydrogenase, FAD-containing subunit n=1 Tax=Pseudonocardia thermophila TaxID=1848 RepID=A0A1M6PF06_PSETH|nr:FAD-dependent oxidoreductase [Pseudonocardia thermophila]SHK06535.1 NADH dehydrogenase, FAD-containing subunit [Pseudonocardia thermophila]
MNHRIVVLGAGYSGVLAAGRLARRLADVEIVLVNAEPDFVERVRLHQLAAGQDLPARPLRAMFAGTGVDVRQARVTALDVARKVVVLQDGEPVEYDTLIYALGSTLADHGVPGVAEHAHHVASRPAALRLRSRLQDLPAGRTVLVVGGGLTGIESATEIAEARPDLRVALVTDREPGDRLGARARRHLDAVLNRLHITVHPHTQVTAVDAFGVSTAGGGRIPADVTVWTVGFATYPIAAASGLQVDGDGRIVVDASQRSVSHPDVYAIGDAAATAAVGGETMRMACAAGVPMAQRVADVVAARLTGREIATPPLRFYAQCISLGRRSGILQLVTPDDRVLPIAVVGAVGARMKELVCRGAMWAITHPTMLMPVRRRRVALAEQASPVAS